nr:hypothetical protein [Micromonospora provocatoris]
MIRQVRVELRRSNAPAVAVLLLAIGILGVASMYSFWQGQWLRLGYVHSSAVFFLMPLALAGGAVLGRRDRRTRADELMDSTGRPPLAAHATGDDRARRRRRGRAPAPPCSS